MDVRGGGAMVNVAEIFCSSFSSFSRLVDKKPFLSGELIV